MEKHDCQNHLRRKKASPDRPFLFTLSGLPNVYLAGIQYEECSLCQSVAGVFPALLKLSDTLTRAVIQKPSRLTGSEIRYLRKSMGKKAVDFAQLVGVSSEQVSRWENGHNAPEPSAEKLMRLLVANQMELKLLPHFEAAPFQDEFYLLRFHAKEWSGVWQAA